MTDKECEALPPEQFETAALLRAVDAVDDLRGDLGEGVGGRPPQLRTDLLKLHRLAMAPSSMKARAARLPICSRLPSTSKTRCSP